MPAAIICLAILRREIAGLAYLDMPRECNLWDEEETSQVAGANGIDESDQVTGSPFPANPTSSPWQDSPSPYASHLSSLTLPRNAQVCIIGTGLSGISTAWHLLVKHPSLKITFLEARTLCSAATGRNGGHLTCDLYSFAPGLLAAGYTPTETAAHGTFELDNFSALCRVVEAYEIDCEFTYKRHDDVCATKEELETVKEAVECMRRCGGPVEGVRIMVNPEASRVLGRPCHGLVRHDYSVSLNPYKLATGMFHSLMTRFPDRIQLFTHTPVQRVVCDVVYTPRGSMACRDLIFATNGYTSTLLPQLKDVIVPVRGQVVSRALDNLDIQNRSYNLGGEYLSQRPGGRIILGGGRRFARHEEIGNHDDGSISSEVSRYLHEFADSLGTRDENQIETREWSGIMGFAKLGIPLVTRLPRLDPCRKYVIAGFTGHGMPRIFLSAKHIASLILQDVTGRATDTTVPAGYETIKTMSREDLADR